MGLSLRKGLTRVCSGRKLVSLLDRAPAVPAGMWTPINLGAVLKGWWSADRADLITLSGAQVTSWKDIVAARDLAQAVSGARPLYSITGFNGAPGVTFDGVDDEVSIATSPFPGVALPCEMWALADQTALVADATTRILFAYGSGAAANSRRGIARVVAAGVNQGQVRVGNGTTTPVATVDGFSGRCVLRGVVSGTDCTAVLDGVAGAPVAAVPSTSGGSPRTRIGANCGSTAANFFQGTVRDVIVTDALTVGQVASLLAYLESRKT